MPDRPNFFLLLELDPVVDDWTVIELHIQERRRVWAKDRSQGSPKLRRRAETGLGLLPEIESVLRNPETRRQEAKEARRQKQQDDALRLQELDGAIAVLKTGGATCSPEQIQKLVQRFAPAISPDQVRRRVEAAGLRVGSSGNGEKKRPARETIDPGQARKIRHGLEHLGLADLYQFLGMRPQSSPKALRDRADEIYKESMRSGRTDAEASTRNDLAGYCKALFQDDGQKTRYDNTLAVEAMEALKANIELAASGDGALSRQEMDALVRQARQRGVPAEDARAYIENLAATRKWFVHADEGELPSETLKVCGFCSALASAGAVRCASCGEPLEVACPRCGARNPTSNSACASCGCRTGDAPLVQGLLAEGERLALEGAFPAAQQCFEKALLYWPGWQAAIEAQRRAGEKRQAREDALGAIEALLTLRKLTAARTAIERFARAHGTAGIEDLRRRVRDGLKKAEALFQEGGKRRRRRWRRRSRPL